LDQYKAHTNLNAVTYIDEAKLAEDARAIDRSRAQGAQLALAGLPIIIKDNINTAGFPTTAGTPFLKNYRPKANAPLADMLFKQGAILFAKSNMHELALGSTSANPTFGYVKNPYDLSRIPGGSSGGTAAAVAARIVPAGLGTDTTGSVRMPAHFCGIAGLRPSNPQTNKPYPIEGIVPLELEFDVAGPMARNVADIALVHAAITHQAELTPADLRGTRIGVPRGYFWETLDGDVAKIMEATLDKLRGAGAVVVDVDFGDLIKAALVVRVVLRPENFRVDLAEFLAREYPAMTMKDAIAGIASKRVRARQRRPARRSQGKRGPHRRQERRQIPRRRQHPSARAHPLRVRPHDRDSDPNRSRRHSRRIPRRRAGALHTARGTGEAAHDKDHLTGIPQMTPELR
jgi:indoleacetamide hydrolase